MTANRRIGLAVAALASVGLLTGVALATTQASRSAQDRLFRSAGIDPTVANRLEVAASQFAAANGENAPTAAAIVATTRSAAAGVAGSAVTAPQDAYMVAMRGHFTIDAPRPPGTPAPSGSELAVVFAADGRVLDAYLGNKPIDPARLGPAVSVVLP